MDPSRPAVVGTVVWAVALVVLLLGRDELPADQRWWVWTAVVGLGLGLIGSAVSLRRRRHVRRQVVVGSASAEGSSTTTADSGVGGTSTGSAASTGSSTTTTSTGASSDASDASGRPGA